ncbi:hypothetical protein EJ02DRAFT_133504 [Clathrospora elynae]|uniref:Uncharacterized protein n=1 Tax=Clathrospora elynae TaxID=706981 RepID=A0A6A5SUE7_9PLEO|nr:hypothetical protein EJ02DRAFT_133504 [Clathrospora elynae]
MRFSPALGREPQWSWDITIELQGASMELGCKPAAIIATWLRFQGGPDGIRTPLRPSDR